MFVYLQGRHNSILMASFLLCRKCLSGTCFICIQNETSLKHTFAIICVTIRNRVKTLEKPELDFYEEEKRSNN